MKLQGKWSFCTPPQRWILNDWATREVPSPLAIGLVFLFFFCLQDHALKKIVCICCLHIWLIYSSTTSIWLFTPHHSIDIALIILSFLLVISLVLDIVDCSPSSAPLPKLSFRHDFLLSLNSKIQPFNYLLATTTFCSLYPSVLHSWKNAITLLLIKDLIVSPCGSSVLTQKRVENTTYFDCRCAPGDHCQKGKSFKLPKYWSIRSTDRHQKD